MKMTALSKFKVTYFMVRSENLRQNVLQKYAIVFDAIFR